MASGVLALLNVWAAHGLWRVAGGNEATVGPYVSVHAEQTPRARALLMAVLACGAGLFCYTIALSV
jgi:hypothetical protein